MEREKPTNEQEKAINDLILRGRPNDEILELHDGNKAIISKDKIKELIKEKNRGDIDDFLIYEYDKDGIRKSDKPKVNIEKVSDWLIERFNFLTVFGSKNEVTYFYDKGIWINSGRAKIKTEIEKLLANYSRNNVVNEIFEKIKRKTELDFEKFDKSPEDLIPLKNGVFNLKTNSLQSYQPEYYFKTNLPIEYNPDVDCPNIKKFFEETFYPNEIPVIQEWIGFNLYRRYFIKKSLIVFGPKDTGKTIFQKLLSAFLERKNIAGISLQRIASGDKFALASLKDKYANIYDDLSGNDLSEQGGLKMSCGGGYITAEFKFGDSFQFLTFAKNTYGANKIPPIKDIDDEAYYDRWLPLPCDNEVSKEEQDSFLIDKLTTKEELSGLFNYGLIGLKRLFENNKFSYNKSSEQIKQIMQRHGDNLLAFTQDCLIQEDGSRIPKDLMFEIYSVYCSNKKISRLSKEQLGRRLAKKTTFILDKHYGGKRVWENVKFSDFENLKGDVDTYNTFKSIIESYLDKEKKGNKIVDMFSDKVLLLTKKEDTYNTSKQKANTENMTEEELMKSVIIDYIPDEKEVKNGNRI